MTSLRKSASTSECDARSLGMHYRMDGILDPQPKRGPDVKIIIQSLKLKPVMEHNGDVARAIACNPTKMFKSSIQHANDSGSMDTSLEYKSFSVQETKSQTLNRRKLPCVDELREILKENKHFKSNKTEPKCDANETPSKLPFMNRKNLPDTPAEAKSVHAKMVVETPPPPTTICEKYIDLLPMMDKKMPASSTPFRPPKLGDEMNNNCATELNLMTPSADVQFIDADIDLPYGGDFNKTLVKCFSLTRASCRRMASFRKSARKQDCKSEILTPSSPKFERRTLFTSSFNANTNRSSIVSTAETSPLHRQKNVKLKNSKILNFFRSSKVNVRDADADNDRAPMRLESDLAQTCNNLSRLLEKSNEKFDELGCTPLLTADNIHLHSNTYESNSDDCDKTISWDDKFEFSYLCEPSSSDIDDEHEQDEHGLQYFPSTDCRKRLPFIPFVKVSPPSIELSDTDQLRSNRHSNGCNINSSPFRRSASDPALIRLATAYNRRCVDLNSAFDTNMVSCDRHSCAAANTVSAFTKRNCIVSWVPPIKFIWVCGCKHSIQNYSWSFQFPSAGFILFCFSKILPKHESLFLDRLKFKWIKFIE